MLVELRDCVFIKGFPSNCRINISDVRKYFQEKVGECCVQMTALSKDKRWSFVTLKFESSSIAESVIERFSGNYIYGHRVTMSYWRVPKHMTHSGRLIKNLNTLHNERWEDKRHFDKETERSQRHANDFSRENNSRSRDHMSRDEASYNDEEKFREDPDDFREYPELRNISDRYTSNTGDNFGYKEHWGDVERGEGRYPTFGGDKSGWDSEYSVSNENFSEREYYEREKEIPFAQEKSRWQEREVDGIREHFFVDQDDAKDHNSNFDECDSYFEQYDYDDNHYSYNERPFEDTDEDSSYTGSFRSEDLSAMNRQWHDERDYTDAQGSLGRNQEHNQSDSPLLEETRQWPRWEAPAPSNPTRRRLSDPDIMTDRPKDTSWTQNPRNGNNVRDLSSGRPAPLLEERPHSDEWLRNTHRRYPDRGRRSASPVNFYTKGYGQRGSPPMDKNFKASSESSFKTVHSNRGRTSISPARGRHSSTNRERSSKSSSTERNSEFKVHKTSPGSEMSIRGRDSISPLMGRQSFAYRGRSSASPSMERSSDYKVHKTSPDSERSRRSFYEPGSEQRGRSSASPSTERSSEFKVHKTSPDNERSRRSFYEPGLERRERSSESPSTERNSDFKVRRTSPERSRKSFDEHSLEQRKRESRSYSPNPNSKVPSLRGRSHEGVRGGKREFDLRRSLMLHQQRKHSSFRQRHRDEDVKNSDGGSKTSPDKHDRSPAKHRSVESSASTQGTNRKRYQREEEKRRNNNDTTKRKRKDSQTNSESASTQSDAENVLCDSTRNKRTKTASENRSQPSPNQKRNSKQEGKHATDTSNTKRADRLLSDLAATLAEGNIQVRRPIHSASNSVNTFTRKDVGTENGRMAKSTGLSEGSHVSNKSCYEQGKTVATTVTENRQSVLAVEDVSCASETLEEWSNEEEEELPEGEIATPESISCQFAVQSFDDSSDEDMLIDAEFDSSNEFSEENFDYLEEGTASDKTKPENHGFLSIKKTCTFIADDFGKTDKACTNFDSYSKVSVKGEAEFVAKVVEEKKSENKNYVQKTTTDGPFGKPPTEVMSANLQHVNMEISPTEENPPWLGVGQGAFLPVVSKEDRSDHGTENSYIIKSSDQVQKGSSSNNKFPLLKSNSQVLKTFSKHTLKDTHSYATNTELRNDGMNVICTRPEKLLPQIDNHRSKVAADALKQRSYNTQDLNCDNSERPVCSTVKAQVETYAEKKQGISSIEKGVRRQEIDKKGNGKGYIDSKIDITADITTTVLEVPEMKPSVNYFKCKEKDTLAKEGVKITQPEVYDKSNTDHAYNSKSKDFNADDGKYWVTYTEQVCVERESVTQPKLYSQVGIGEDDKSNKKYDNMENALLSPSVLKHDHCYAESIDGVYKEEGNPSVCRLKDEKGKSESAGFDSFNTQQDVRDMKTNCVTVSVDDAKQQEAYNTKDNCVTQQVYCSKDGNNEREEVHDAEGEGVTVNARDAEQKEHLDKKVDADEFEQVDMEISFSLDEEHQNHFKAIAPAIHVDTDTTPVENDGGRPYSPSSPTWRSDEQRSPLPKDDASLYSPSHPTTVSEASTEVSVTIEDVSFEDDKRDSNTSICDKMEVENPDNNSRNVSLGEGQRERDTPICRDTAKVGYPGNCSRNVSLEDGKHERDKPICRDLAEVGDPENNSRNVSFEHEERESDIPTCRDTAEVAYPENNVKNSDNDEEAKDFNFNQTSNDDGEGTVTSRPSFSKSEGGLTDANLPINNPTQNSSVTTSNENEENCINENEVCKDNMKPLVRCQTRAHSSPASISMESKPKTVYVTAAKTYDLYTFSGARHKPRILYATNVKTTEPVRSLSLDKGLGKSWPLRTNSDLSTKSTSTYCELQPMFEDISTDELEKKKGEADSEGNGQPFNTGGSLISGAPLETRKISAHDEDQEAIKISTTSNSAKPNLLTAIEGTDTYTTFSTTGSISSADKESAVAYSSTGGDTIPLGCAPVIQAVSDSRQKDVPTDQFLSTEQSPSHKTVKKTLSASNTSSKSAKIPTTSEFTDKRVFTTDSESCSFGLIDERMSSPKNLLKAERTCSKVHHGSPNDDHSESLSGIPRQLSPQKSVQMLSDSALHCANKRTHPDSASHAARASKVPRKPLKLIIPTTPGSNRSVRRKSKPTYLARCSKKTSTCTVTRASPVSVPEKHSFSSRQSDVAAITEQSSFNGNVELTCNLTPAINSTPTMTDSLLPAYQTGNTSSLTSHISPCSQTPTAANRNIRERAVSGVSKDSRAGGRGEASDWVALKMKRLQKKKQEIEQVYKRECRTVVNVVKMLVSNDPRLEGLLQNAVRRSLQDMGRRCVQELEKQARPGT